MIIEYEPKYDEEIKDLLVELQEYIVSIDKEKYNIITPEYREKYFKKTMDEINNNKGKIFLAKDNNNITGLIIGYINNEEINEYDFKAPKRGKISELIVSKNCRTKGMGTKLLEEMEKYLKSIGCIDILIEVFGYNDIGLNFYNKHSYHNRMFEMTKKIK